MSTITARYVDTCLSDYLQDSYSRPGQALCLASLGCSIEQTVEELLNSLDDSDSGFPETIGNDEIKEVLAEAIEAIDLRYIDENGNRCQTPPEEDRDCEEPMLYVLIEWDASVVKLRMTVDVEYQANGVDSYELKLMLEDAIRQASANGALTGGTGATVTSWGASAEVVPEE